MFKKLKYCPANCPDFDKKALLKRGMGLLTRAHDDDAGADIHTVYSVTLERDTPQFIDTYIQVAIPKNWVGLILPRSSMNKKGIETMLGVIDAGYRGTIKVGLTNHSDQVYKFDPGAAIAQLVVVPCLTRMQLVEDEEYLGMDTERGAQGFGSSDRLNKI